MRVEQSGWEWSYTNVFPIIYTSVDEFLFQLELAVTNWIDARNALLAEQTAEQQRYNSLNHEDKRKKFKIEILDPIYKKILALNDASITVGDNVIKLDDVAETSDGKMFYSEPFSVMTVEQFFASVEKVS